MEKIIQMTVELTDVEHMRKGGIMQKLDLELSDIELVKLQTLAAVNGQTIDECISYIIINRLNKIVSAIGDEIAVTDPPMLH